MEPLAPLEPLPREAVVVNGGTPSSALGATGAGVVQQAPMTCDAARVYQSSFTWRHSSQLTWEIGGQLAVAGEIVLLVR